MSEFKIAFEDLDSGLFEIKRIGSNEPGQILTEPELRKLQILMPDVRWIIVQWVEPTNKNTK